MRFLLFPLLTLMLSGCAGYKIGPIQPSFMEGVRSIAVPTFENPDNLQPRIEVLIANAVIKQIQQDGTFRVEPTETADVILQGRVVQVTRRSARSLRGNVLATREFVLTLTIEYEMIRRDTGLVLDGRSVNGSTNFFVGNDLQQNERQALPLAAEDAAVRLVSQISEGW